MQFLAPEDEILRNRVWTVALLGMSLGFYGLFASFRPSLRRMGRIACQVMLVGFGLLTLGSFIEYWILFGLPHQGGGVGSVVRSLPWMAFLIGALLMFGASAVVGASMVTASVVPKWLGPLFLALLPLTIALAFLHPGLAALPIGCLSAAGLVVLREPGRQMARQAE